MSFNGLYYKGNFVSGEDKRVALEWLTELNPIWEHRYATSEDDPSAKKLLRPVYWLGNWQFACLNYFHPPKGVSERCIEAEPFPEFMKRWMVFVEKTVKKLYLREHLPPGWKLNTCLVNYYGDSWNGSKWIDVARVGEHKDFEPGPVASISFGERAFFQFVKSQGKGRFSQVVCNQWLEDGSLQIFGGPKWKDFLFHRVQRVEKKNERYFGVKVSDFRVRRINLTFRYVPDKYVIPYRKLSFEKQKTIGRYVRALAPNSKFWYEASCSSLPLQS